MNRFIILLFALAACTMAYGKVQLPRILSGNMVLQQNASVKLWGKAKPKARVTVRVSWDKKKQVTEADGEGRWLIKVQTPEASYTPQHFEVSDGDGTARADNILIGEVWLCSGQSNMEMPLGGFLDSSTEEGNEAIAEAGLKPGIRVLTVKRTGAHVPVDTCANGWKVCNAESAPGFSAVGYFFAERLNRILDVPVGVICTSYGGSRIEGWLPREIVQNYKDIDLSRAELKNKRGWHAGVPTIMYNSMLYPFKNYTIKGFLWYQGEANIHQHADYAERMKTLVKRWREDWGLGELPFYMAEIAPFDDGGKLDRALLREAQYKAVSELTNCGIVCTNDLVLPEERNQIHPRQKRAIGDRFAYLALNNDYGYKDIHCLSPTYKSMEVKDTAIVVHFNNVKGFSTQAYYEGFEICGSDRVFHPAQAKTDYRTMTVKVWSDRVKHPVAVRYCFRDFQIGTLKTNRLLPFAPFRTDDFK